MLVEVPSMNLQVGDIIYISFIPFQSKSKHRNRFCYTFLTRTWKRMTSYPVTPCFSTRVDREEIVSFAYGNMRGLIPQTSNIDGESDLKVRKVPPQLYSRLQGKTQDEIHQVLNSLSLEIFCGRPDCHLYQFDARYGELVECHAVCASTSPRTSVFPRRTCFCKSPSSNSRNSRTPL